MSEWMSGWALAAWLMLGGSTVLLFIGMPVALTFITINILGAWFYMGGEPGLMQLTRSSVSSVTAFSLTPIPLFVLMGEILFHTGLALKVIEGVERLIHRIPGRLAVVAVVAVVSAGIAVAVGSGANVPLLQLRFYTRALPGLVLLSSALFFSVYSSIMFLTDH